MAAAYQVAFRLLSKGVDDGLFTAAEVCEVLHISRPTYYRDAASLKRLRLHSEAIAKLESGGAPDPISRAERKVREAEGDYSRSR